MSSNNLMSDVWSVFADLSCGFYAAADTTRAQRGGGWFAAISGVNHGELNICGLSPWATAVSAHELTAALGDLPGVVFTSEVLGDDVRDPLVAQGFQTASTPEPLMIAGTAPTTIPGEFRVEVATIADIETAVDVTAEAHHVDPALLTQTIGAAHRSGSAEVWLAWDGDEAVSVAWLCRVGDALGVAEMMTPERHQRRGAGRQLLSTALATRWTPWTSYAVLLSTPAGRRLYESLGFVAADEVITLFRGHDEDLIAAIGQTSVPQG